MRKRVGALVASVVIVALGAVVPAAPATAVSRGWTGGGSTDNWSEAANWSGGAAPTTGDDVVLPAGSARPASVNDQPALTYRSITTADGRDIGGQLLSLGSGGLAAGGAVAFTGPVSLAADQVWATGAGVVVNLGGSLATNGHRLELRRLGDGSGAVHTNTAITGGGVLALRGSSLSLFGSSSAAALDVGEVSDVQLHEADVRAAVTVATNGHVVGSGSVDSLAVRGGRVRPGDDAGAVLRVRGDLRISERGALDVIVGNGWRVAAGGVHLADAQLWLSQGAALADGAAVTIVDNVGGAMVDGTFAGIPEGGRLIGQGVEYRITYRGGDGNDVVATVLRHGARPVLRVPTVVADEGTRVTVRAVVDPPTTDPVSYRLLTIPLEANRVDDFTPDGATFFGDEGERVGLVVDLLADGHRERDERVGIEVSGLNGVALGEVGAVVIRDGTPAARAAAPGFRFVAADGGVFTFGERTFDGAALGGTAPAAGLAPLGVRSGYVVARADGSTWATTGARTEAGRPTVPPRAPIVGLAMDPAGDDYWTVGSDGGVFSHLGAPFHGSTGALRLNRPIVGMAATPFGDGYWLVATDGGIFAFGDAGFFGSTGAMRLNSPIVGMAATPSGQGYWLVAADGGIFAFGDAGFFGSTGAMRLNQPIVGMAATPSGQGYWLVARDGGVFAFGDAPFLGSTGDLRLNSPIVGMAA
jgi:hypothetical protein